MASWDHADHDRLRGPATAVAVLVAALLAGWLAGTESVESPGGATDELGIERADSGDVDELPLVGLVGDGDAQPWSPPEPGSWSTLPPAPIGHRMGHTVAYVDGVVIVWGGYQDQRPLANGAVFDPDDGRWSPIADAPESEDGHVPVAAGRTLLLLHERRPIAYEPRRATWRRLSRPPVPDGYSLGNVTAWTGRVAVVLTGRGRGEAGPALAYDVIRDEWTSLPAPPVSVSHDHALVWNGRDLLLLGRSAAGAEGFAHRLSFGRLNRPSPGVDPWEPVAAPPLGHAASRASAVRAVPSGSVRAGDPVYVWVGPRLGGADAPRLLAYSGAPGVSGTGERWTDLGTPPLDEPAPTLAWTGRDLLAVGWSDVIAYRPAVDLMIRLPDSGLLPQQQRKATWTGEYLVWWGGASGDGAVWRPPEVKDDLDPGAVPERLTEACIRVPIYGCPYGATIP